MGLCLLATLACTGPQLDLEPEAPAAAWTRLSAELMTTRWELVLPGGPDAEVAAQDAFAAIAQADLNLNEWKAGSPLAEVNRRAGEAATPVPTDLRALLHTSRDLHTQTGGAFDVTWAALWRVWDFAAEHPAPPDPAVVRARLPLIDGRLVEVDDAAGTVRLPRAGMLIGLGGIAKGWALDRAGERLRAHGQGNWMIRGGGQVVVAGTQDGRAWRVGLRDPRGDASDIFAELDLADGEGISTSGDYERFFLHGGARYHHILDPRTGYPTTGIRAAVVLTRNAAQADALSTAVMVMGPEAGLNLLERLPDVEGLVIDAAGQLHTTANLINRLRILHPPYASP